MIRSLDASIVKCGNVVRSGIARPATVARYLETVTSLADYQVSYWYRNQPHQVTAEGFLTLYAVGRLPQPPTMREDPTWGLVRRVPHA
jgi:hypothetical protein